MATPHGYYSKPQSKFKTTRSTRRRFAAVLVGVALLGPTFHSGEALAQQGAGRGSAVTVEVVKPTRRMLTRELELPATLAPDEAVDLFAKTSGYVAAVKVDIGDRVHKGDVLVKIDVPEMADELRQAEAVLQAKGAKVRALKAKAVQAQRMVETAQAQVRRYQAQHELEQINLKRKQELREGNAIPQQALDEARSAHAVTQAQYQIAIAQVAGAEAEKQAVEADGQVAEADVSVAQANVARLKTLMEYATIRAPFDGTITVRNVDHGTFVRSAAGGSAASLLRIVKTDKIRLILDIPESDVQDVHVGTRVSINVKAMRQEPFEATVTRTAGTLRVETRTMRVEVDIDNTDGRFTPGMYAQVAVTLGANPQALVIPSKALRFRGRESVVMVAANGIAQRKKVAIGYDDGIWTEITSGLSGDELIIISGGSAIVSGTPVAAVLEGTQ